MSKANCYLCASDEGILLDIFGDAGKTFRDNIETCLSVKVKREDARSNKICHKCAYEIEACGKFLDKYKRFKDSAKGAADLKLEYCGLCGSTAGETHLLRVKAGNSLKNSLRKIEHVIDKDLFKDEVAHISVCLDCRYNVDVLFDLRGIYRETPKKLKSVDETDLNVTDLPKTRTSVVIRNTTYIPSPDLNGNRDWDSDASTVSNGIMSLKRKRGRSRKESLGTGAAIMSPAQYRSCEQCDTQVEQGIDMYRYHRTGLTVCKDCWLTMDPERVSTGKRKKFAKADPENSTKLCAVFLKDVLTNPSKYKNIYKVEKDKQGNTTFLITDESSENEDKDKDKDKAPLKRGRPRASTSSVANVEMAEVRKAPKRTLLTKKNAEGTWKKAKPSPRRSKELSESPPTSKTRAKNGIDENDSTTSSAKMRTRRRSVEVIKVMGASPESQGRGRRTSARLTGLTPKTSRSKRLSSSDEKSWTRRECSIEARTDLDTPKLGRTKRIEIDEQPLESRFSKRARSNSFTDTATTKSQRARRHDASSEGSLSDETRVADTATKITKRAIKNAKSDSELEKPYTCSVCQTACANKLVGKAHELTHEKQPEVKLRRVVIPPETIAEETPLEISNAKESDEVSGIVSEPCAPDDVHEKLADEPNVEDEKAARPVTPEVTDAKREAEKTNEKESTAKELTLDAEKCGEDDDNNEKEEKVNSEQTDVSLTTVDNAEEETTESKEKNEDEAKSTSRGKNSGPENNKVDDSGENEVEKEREEDAKTKEDKSSADETSTAIGFRESDNECTTKHEESVKPKDLSLEVGTKPTEDIETEVTDSTDVALDKKELDDPEKDKNVVADTVPRIGDETGESVERDVRDIETDGEKNPKEDETPRGANGAPEKIKNSDEIVKVVTDPAAETEREELEKGEHEETGENKEKEEKSEKDKPRLSHEKEEVAEKDEKQQDKDAIENTEDEAAREKKEEKKGHSEKTKEKEEKKHVELAKETVEDKEIVSEERKEGNENKTEEMHGNETRKANGNKTDEADGIDRKKEAENIMETEQLNENETLDIELKDEDKDSSPRESPEHPAIIEEMTEGESQAPIDSVSVGNEIHREVFDLASDEVKKRLDKKNKSEERCATPETLENISLEVQNSGEGKS